MTNATAIRGLLSLGGDRFPPADVSRQVPDAVPTDLVRPQKAVHFLATSSLHDENSVTDNSGAFEDLQAPVIRSSEIDPRLDAEPAASCSSHGPVLASSPPPAFAESTAFTRSSSTLASLLRKPPLTDETITGVMDLYGKELEAAWEWSTVLRTALQMRRRLP